LKAKNIGWWIAAVAFFVAATLYFLNPDAGLGVMPWSMLAMGFASLFFALKKRIPK
jgi:hypothetical protein